MLIYDSNGKPIDHEWWTIGYEEIGFSVVILLCRELQYLRQMRKVSLSGKRSFVELKNEDISSPPESHPYNHPYCVLTFSTNAKTHEPEM